MRRNMRKKHGLYGLKKTVEDFFTGAGEKSVEPENASFEVFVFFTERYVKKLQKTAIKIFLNGKMMEI